MSTSRRGESAERQDAAGDGLGAVGGETLPGLLNRHAAGSRVALVDARRAVTYRELVEASRRLAGGLRGLGIRAGDRVTIWMPNGTAWVASFFACAQLGAIAVALNPRFRSHEVGDILARTGSRAVILEPSAGDFVERLAACPREQLTSVEWLVANGDAPDALAGGLGARVVGYGDLVRSEPLAEDAPSPDTPCVIFTTSGTTKAPKFVLHSQASLTRHGADVARMAGISPQSVVLQAPPLCGTYGMSTAFGALAAGAALVMMPTWDAREAAGLIDAFGATHTMATDDAVLQLLAETDAPRPFPTLGYVGLAGTNPMLGDIYERAGDRGLRLVGLYGSSEVQAVFSLQHADAPLDDRSERGGFPVGTGAQVRASDPASRDILPHGVAGELEFKAPDSGMLGYFGDEAATREAFGQDGFFRSGDLGYTREDGRFVFLARLGDSLRLGGFLVNPAEIEEVIEEVDGVRQAQVVGVETAEGPRPVAFVIPDESGMPEAEAVIAHVRGKLARFKVPVRVFPIDAFPVTVSANATKIQKGKLRELAGSLMA